MTPGMTYGDYLQLDAILSAQNLRTDAHDEMLFIVQHQTSELWMRLALHELNAAREALQADTLQTAFKMLARIARIFEQLNNAWDVLRTMTPSEYTQFRAQLDGSSGFQSYQYRLIEFTVGNRNDALIAMHDDRPDVVGALKAEMARPSLYDAALDVLHRRVGPLPDQVMGRDRSGTHKSDPAIIAAWKQVYTAPQTHWELYELAEKLVDFEDYFRRWRFNHVTTVERIIGMKRGTGGTAGVSYLRRMLATELFPDLWHLRTEL